MLRLDGYVRVSRVGYRSGERFISPGVQRDQIIAWAAARPATVLHVWEELDESGGRPDRPLLETAVTRIEQGLSQGLVVASVDRFGRSLRHDLAMLERIEQAAGTFVSVREGFDASTDAGRMALHIVMAIAEFYSRGTRATWETAVAKAIARGVFVGSVVPVGYRKLRSGRLRPDARLAPVMTELFQRRAAGSSLWDLAHWLEEQGVRTANGNPGWLPATVRNVLGNRVYLGGVRYGRQIREDAHVAITDEATWHGAQQPRRYVMPRGSCERLLSGLLRCASCGRKMHPYNAPRGYYYGCARRTAAGECPAPAIMARVPLELCVEDVVLDLLRRRRRPAETALREAEQHLDRAQRALTAYRDSDRVLVTLGVHGYEDGLALRTDRVRDAALNVMTARTRHGLHDLPRASELEAQWPTLSIPARREIIGQVVDCIVVQPGRRHFDERIWVCPTGTGPAGLPRPGDVRTRLRQLQPRRRWVSARYATDRPPRWSSARLERELAAFVAGRTLWPSGEQFLNAGRSRLYRQMQLQGGEHYWAGHFDLPRYRRAEREWTDAEIRETLRTFLDGRTVWPRSPEFAAAKLSSLRNAISDHGGARRWAAEFNLKRTHPRSNGPIRYWTDERIAVDLAEFCRGRSMFPSRTEFARAGLGAMVNAMDKRGGLAAWASRTGLPRRPR